MAPQLRSLNLHNRPPITPTDYCSLQVSTLLRHHQVCSEYPLRVYRRPKKMRITSEPHYSFTIPSIYDDTTLDCRIYHPAVLDEPLEFSSGTSQWRKRGIVMAHPYAPMGGSYDDRVVGIVVDELLKAEYIVGTFNFRYDHMALEAFEAANPGQGCSRCQTQKPYLLVW